MLLHAYIYSPKRAVEQARGNIGAHMKLLART